MKEQLPIVKLTSHSFGDTAPEGDMPKFSKTEVCPTCGGEGKVPSGTGKLKYKEICPKCAGCGMKRLE